MHAVVDGRWKLSSAYGVAHDGLESSGNNVMLVSDVPASRDADATDTQDRPVDKRETKHDRYVRTRRAIEERPPGRTTFEREQCIVCVRTRMCMTRAHRE